MSITKTHPLEDADRAWAAGLLTERWGSALLVSRGHLWDATTLPGFVAEIDTEPAGLVTYRIDGEECEVTSLDSLRAGQGVGAALLEVVHRAARAAGCRRAWLITTNDNTHALRFYQRRGYCLTALYPGAVEHSRRLKPSIPLVGMDGIPLRDEIELSFWLK
ncbi:MAG: GNAT family N-acetyltransferase [Anaerolineae bacterium]|nr:GNAT family N-acetyltransferase [Anaerolineae bacterium]